MWKTMWFVWSAFVVSVHGIRFITVDRVIDLKTQLVRITNSIHLENQIDLETIDWIPTPEGVLTFCEAHDENNDTLDVYEEELNPRKIVIKLPDWVKNNENVRITVTEVYTNALSPLPTAIKQTDPQFFTYNGSSTLNTPYHVITQTTKVVFPLPRVLQWTKTTQNANERDKFIYGPFADVPPFYVRPIFFHFESYSPFVKIKSLIRTITISHWDNIQIEEEIEIYNGGAKLKGSFSRSDLMNGNNYKMHFIGSITTCLPNGAKNIYYRDVIGNISTSQVESDGYDEIEVDIKPRFPLFGGWRTVYTLGYDIPANNHLLVKDNTYKLSMPLLDHVCNDMHVEKLTTKIILPLLAREVELTLPYTMIQHPDTLIYKYLDTIGRKVITLSQENLVDDHMQTFDLEYKWERYVLWYEPIMLSLFIFSILLVLVIIGRLDFSLPNKEIGTFKYERMKKHLKTH